MPNIYAFDIGNSDIVVGRWNTEVWEIIQRIPSKESKGDPDILEGALEVGWDGAGKEEVDAVIVSSVVPELTEHVIRITGTLYSQEPFLINADSYSTLPMNIESPQEIGSDLVSNAVAAYNYFGSQVLIVDFGTALTFTQVDREGHIDGVAIFPGVKTAIGSLIINTSLLPEVSLEIPDSVSGKNTVHAIQSGVMYGYASIVEGMIKRFESELGKSKVMATGGLAESMGSIHSMFDRIDPFLTLEGMRLIYKMNNE